MTTTAPARCDLLIIGAGPAGMAAALAAAESGMRIVVVDDNPAPGGQIWRNGPGVQLPPLARQHREGLARHANIEVLSGTRVVGLGDRANTGDAAALILENATRGWTQHASRLILCTGARELLLPFPGWTLPGVTGAGGLQALIKAGLDVRGQRIVIAGTGPLLLAAASTARKAGAQVLRVAEHTSWGALAAFAAQLVRWPAKAWQAPTLLRPSLRANAHVLEALGNTQVEAVRLQRGSRTEQLECERIACGFGLVPNTHLGQMLGCTLGERHGLQVDAGMRTTVPGIYAAGECTGFGGSERALVQGAMAGHAAAGEADAAQALQNQLARWNAFADALHRHFPLRAETLAALPRPDTFVCRCEDVAHGVLRQRSNWIDAKLHTRCGMGACQGRICGAAAQVLYGWTPQPARHLLSPARIATLADAGGKPSHESATQT
ncbi:FAD-dependent oxidoreductase [Simplicispira suum]|uniref:Pyridine nucleotide-disulfide oxidoreductase n=1 Tax=Simplicispira suum TaxID=2109915 RepID=A0A2S0N2N6_9BURK|nr:FAD-dependent oxidoreductase [Simplicispira suum]AVO42414.1 pyridine nucleotide-disulfide oxidoreductase [Simplicispira suum]